MLRERLIKKSDMAYLKNKNIYLSKLPPNFCNNLNFDIFEILY